MYTNLFKSDDEVYNKTNERHQESWNTADCLGVKVLTLALSLSFVTNAQGVEILLTLYLINVYL